MNRAELLVVFIVLFAGGFNACSSTTSIAAPPVPVDTSTWPQMVVTNDAEFSGHTSLSGASAFFVRSESGRIVMATARHLLGVNGGVRPVVPVGGLDRVLTNWNLFVRTRPGSAASASGLVFDGNSAARDSDWLLVSLTSSDSLPANPLSVRRTPVSMGEQVFLIGCPYSERDCQQNIYRGEVTQIDDETHFRFSVSPPVDLRGFSGAPIVDSERRVVGVTTVWFERHMIDGRDILCGGEASTVIVDVLEGNAP